MAVSREPRARRGRVVRAPTPPRGPLVVDGQTTLWTLSPSAGAPVLRANLIAFADAAELEILVDDELRRRLRFIRDAGARTYAERLRRRLTARGYSPVAA
jgi:hypothetical protein